MKKRVRAYMRNGRNRRFWKRLLSVLSCVVVFVTTYALLLPAVTLEKTAACGMEAHQHDQSCFEQHLICGLEETDGHQHTDDCYTVNRVLACTIEEHSHTEECFNEEGELTCALAEHSHDDGCWREDRVLSCKKEETEPHHHTDTCYESVLVCQKPVHIHSPECYVERSLNLAQYLSADTTIYVRAAGDESEGGLNEGWLRVDDTAEITVSDLVRLHYAYTIPAGTLTGDNRTIRYALPDNVRLTDGQIREVNAMNGGRGAEAVEGTRTPDQEQTGNEYVSAWILFENVYNKTDKKHKDPIGQNLILTFDDAALEKNRKVFGQDGALVDPGEEINGFFSIDINTDQISFDRGGDSDGEKETDVTLVEENKDLGIAPIRRTIRVIEAEEEQAEAVPEILNEEARVEEEFAAAEDEAVVEESAVSEDGAVTEENAAAEEDAVIEEDSDTEENAASVEDSAEEDVPAEEAVNGGEAPAEVLAKEGQEDLNQEEQDQEGKPSEEQAADSDKENEEETREKERTTIYQGVADTLTYEGADYTVTASYTEDAGIPDGASLVVSEITEDEDSQAYQNYRGQAEEAVGQEPGRKVSWIRLFDITIEKNGKPIEPQGPVSVQITYHEAIEQAADTTVDTVHFEGKKETPKVLETAAEGTDTATEQVSFETDGFSVFAVVGTVIETNVLASDGHNYKVTVTYGEEAGIPDGAELAVEEILAESDLYETYVNKTENVLGLKNGAAEYARMFDIKIVDKNDSSVKYQPAAGSRVAVKIELADADKSNLEVVHFSDENDQGSAVAAETDGQTVSFSADGFSVYVIINHEGEEKIVTPRVEFHFIDYAEPENVSASYTAAPYNFINENGDFQTTQILKDGEKLEMITNPANIVIDNGDGTTSEKFFYGWYVVNEESHNVNLDSETGKYNGTISYSWTDDPQKIGYTDALIIGADDSAQIKVGDPVSWSLGDVTGTGVIDEEGRVHVYLAPLYEDFYFVNFRKGTKDDSSGLSANILARKLIVFGNSEDTEVRIGDVECPSTDPLHKIFVGWETVRDTGGQLEHVEFYQTLDAARNEINSEGHDDGYYISVHKDASTTTQVDLYPVFAEARWLKFNTGKTGNGAKYVSSAYAVTNDEGAGTYFDQAFFTGTETTEGHLSTRAGYDFEGWYAFANLDSDGNISNLDEEQDVLITYLDEQGEKHRVPVSTKAVKLVNADGSLAFDGPYTVKVDGQDVKLFEVIDGKLYFCKAMDDLTLFANWQVKYASYRVIVWKQKVTDNATATDDQKTYDYEIFYTSDPVDTTILPNLTQFAGSYVDSDHTSHQYNGLNLEGMNYEGFHFSRDDVGAVGKPNPDGTTVYNVYYDRNIHTLHFQVQGGSTYTWTETDGSETPQYGLIDGHYVELIPVENGEYHTYKYAPSYNLTTDIGGTQYALIDGNYVALTYGVVSNETTWKVDYTYTRSTSTTGDFFGIYEDKMVPVYYGRNSWFGESSWWRTRTGTWSYTYSNPYSGYHYTCSSGGSYSGARYTTPECTTYATGSTGVQYGINGTTIYQLSPQTTNVYGYLLNGAEYTGPRYIRNDSSIEYSGTRYTDTECTQRTTENGEGQFGKDSNGVVVSLEYETGTAYKWTYVDKDGHIKDYPYKRFVRTSVGNNANWHDIYNITALYGQNISNNFPIQGWNGIIYNNGERWDPQTNTLGWNQVMVTVDSMPNEDVIFHLNEANRPLKTMNYYVEVLPGESGTVTYAGRQFKPYSEPVLARYNGVTQEDFLKLDGFERLAWQSGNTNGTYNTGLDSNGFYIYSTSQAQTINFFYTRNTADFTFDVNYPVDANLEYSQGQSENLTASDIYYQDLISEYGYTTNGSKTHWYYGVSDENNTADHVLFGPDHHIFGGWYEDKSCTVPFNFNSTMPAGNKIVYAKWTPERFLVKVDPNGGEIDHIDHNVSLSGTGYQGNADITPFRQDGSGYDRTQATYFNADYGTMAGEYTVIRDYVPISEDAAESYNGPIYYYINMQYHDTDGPGLVPDLRNALYVTEDEIEQYYEFYRTSMEYAKTNPSNQYAGVQILDFDTWKSLYVSTQEYRKANEGEHYTFLGWFKVVDGVVEDMPYNFSDPITEPITLKALWRLEGGYKLQYVPAFTMPDGKVVNGELEGWDDLKDSDLSYSDSAKTQIYKQPTELTLDGEPVTDDSVIFLGWQLVSRTGTPENPVYTPIEPGVYYDPDDTFMVSAGYADADSNLYFQAVYQYKASSDRRPVVKSLTLDANTGYINTDDSSQLPDWMYYPGTEAINTQDHLTTVDGESVPTQIEFGDIQSSASVHLYKYATNLEADAEGSELTDAQNFFNHPDGHFLLGFDDAPTEGDYIATYPADSVIAITRDEDRTIYAVWEPMVYMTFENKTGKGPVTFGISSNSSESLEVINIKEGMYDRRPLSDLGNIVLDDGESITLAFPKGAEKDITVSGINTLGVGNILIWNTSLNLVEDGTTSTYKTTDNQNTYSHTAGSRVHEHSLASGEKNNTEAFSFDETLIVNEEPVVVTFTSRNNEFALVLNDNYEGGGTQEYDYASADITPGEDGLKKTQELPSTSTRIGYEFQGWAFNPDATEPNYSAANNWMIADLSAETGLFKNVPDIDGTKVVNLYAVWKPKAEASTVYIYKDVPLPGDQKKEYEFTVVVGGTYYNLGNQNQSQNLSETGSFKLAHGEYAKLESSNSVKYAYIQTVITLYNADGTRKKGIGGLVDLPAITVRAQGTAYTNGSFQNTEMITVTETRVEDYETSISRLAQISDNNPILVADSTDTTTNPLMDISGNVVQWRKTDTGGTVVYRNKRQTYDIDVEKSLISNSSATSVFSFEASYEDNGVVTKLDDFTVTSGSKKTLSDIPAGVVLTITEKADENDNYETTVVSQNNAEDLDDTAKTFKFTVTENDKITFENKLKSYPVTFKLVDQDGETTINGMFSLSSAIGSLGSDLYANASGENPGVFYTDDEFWAGTYTLTQTVVQSGYIGPDGPVTITVKGDGTIVSDDPDIAVTGNSTDGFVVTVKNYKYIEVDVAKVLEDPMLTSREFRFTATYTYEGEEITEEFTLTPANKKKLSIPVGAKNLVITENNYLDSERIYDTTTQMLTKVTAGMEAEEITDKDTIVHSFTLGNITSETKDGVLTFTNRRKTVDITVKKEVYDPSITDDFSFTAELKNGAHPITGYQLKPDPNGLTTGETGEMAGKASFVLKHGQQRVLTVPYGSSLTISEISDKYVAVITTDPVIEPTEEVENSFKLTADQNETIKFYNKPRGVKVVLKKAGYRNTDSVLDLKPLAGATFKIHQGSATGQLITTEEEGITKSSFTSEGEDAIFFEGLLESRKSYYLEETVVPDGYMAPTGMYYFTINDDGVVLHCTETTGQASYADWISEETDENGETVYVITIRNVSGIELPSTGGPGTTLIYLLGTILMAFAAIGLVIRKKRRA